MKVTPCSRSTVTVAPEAKALLHCEVANYIQILAWFLEFLLLSYNATFKFGSPGWGLRGIDPLKARHCYILMLQFIFTFSHDFENIYLEVVIMQYLNLKPLLEHLKLKHLKLKFC